MDPSPLPGSAPSPHSPYSIRLTTWIKALTVVIALGHITFLAISPKMTRFLSSILLVMYAQLLITYVVVMGSSWKCYGVLPLAIKVLMVFTGICIFASFIAYIVHIENREDMSVAALLTAVGAWLGIGFAHLWMSYMSTDCSEPDHASPSTPAAFLKVARTLTGLPGL